MPHLLARCLLPILVLVLVPFGDSLARIGLAEWQVYTPGGHIISHQDGFLEDHGNCLRVDNTDRPDRLDRVYVSHIERWRYYEDHVVGKSRRGYFIFDEHAGTVRYFADEPALHRAVERLAGMPESPWLTPADAWQEAWLPLLYWKPCRAMLNGSPTPATQFGPTPHECRKVWEPERIDLYRRTTWGRQCERFRRTGTAPVEWDLMDEFCDGLGL